MTDKEELQGALLDVRDALKDYNLICKANGLDDRQALQKLDAVLAAVPSYSKGKFDRFDHYRFACYELLQKITKR